jgi:paired amphipathic helix protein Sin3a
VCCACSARLTRPARIDTPGVIGRVSDLFAGNPLLIEGFNTFLPHGYHINASAPGDPGAITVTTPSGVVRTHAAFNNMSLAAPAPASPPYSPGPQRTAALASVLGNMRAAPDHPSANLLEFDHAILYLNKIKTRFPDDPDTYKRFLEILQHYRKDQQAGPRDPQAQAQREQKMMHDVRPPPSFAPYMLI